MTAPNKKTAGDSSGCAFILTITTNQYESPGVALFSDVSESLGAEADGEDISVRGEEADNSVTMTTEANVSLEDGRLTISYDETEITGLGNSKTAISFMTDEPGLVSVIRTGEVRTALVLENGKRHICTYDTPIMPFEVCTFARKIANGITEDGGEMHLDYIVEIRGALAQRTRLDITLKKAENIPDFT